MSLKFIIILPGQIEACSAVKLQSNCVPRSRLYVVDSVCTQAIGPFASCYIDWRDYVHGGLEEAQPGKVTFYTNLVSCSFSSGAQALSQAADTDVHSAVDKAHLAVSLSIQRFAVLLFL